jgi:uncharacterized protein
MRLGPILKLPFIIAILVFIASQLFWFRHLGQLSARLVHNRLWRRGLAVAGFATYVLIFAYNIGWGEHGPTAVRLTPEAVLLEAPLRWWAVSSVLGFTLMIALSVLDRVGRALLWAYRRGVGSKSRRAAKTGHVPPPDPPSPSRRRFLEQTAVAVSATPFVACAYGLLYGRLNLETTHQRIRLRRLPKAFQGFRIAQLSDIHIGPFMTAEEVRHYVTVANRLKPDLIVLTGDFVTWDPGTQEAVVAALAGLRAPMGVLGCLGNHEIWTETEDSITSLFALDNIRILRQQAVGLRSQGEMLNLIGVDFQTHRGPGPHGEGFVRNYLEGVEGLVTPEAVNILLSHNPNSFDRAAELGIDLTLAGHTHGGQLALEFVHRNISPGSLITKYVKGWFAKNDAQLYVNRGIGTIGAPIRLNAPPEITVFELVRET